MSPRFFPVALIGLLLSGCISLGPDYKEPVVKVPARWSEDSAIAVWPEAGWWKSFANRELDALIEEAGEKNQDLRAAIIRIDQAEASLRIADAALLPTLSGSGSGTRSDRGSSSQSSTGGTGTARAGQAGRTVTTTYSATLQGSYALDLFGANKATSQAAAQRLASSRYDRETVALTVVSTVATTYFQVVSLRDRRRFAEQNLRISEQILELLENTARIGTTSNLEVAQQRSSIATQRAQIPALALAERQSLNALAVLLGEPPTGFDILTRSLDELRIPVVLAGMPSTLLQRRPDLRKSESDLRAANFDLASAHAARFPTIALTLSGGTSSQQLGDMLNTGSMLWSIAGSLTAPIFQGGRLQAQEDLSEARLRELAETYQKTVITAFQDVENALSATTQNAQQNALQREAYEQAAEALKLAEMRYRVGTVNFQTVLEAQRTIVQTADAVVQSQRDRFTAAVGLYQALGGGWAGGGTP